MLGIDSKEIPVVKGRYAKGMRDTLKRVHTGNLSKADKEIAARSEKILHEFNVIKK